MCITIKIIKIYVFHLIYIFAFKPIKLFLKILHLYVINLYGPQLAV